MTYEDKDKLTGTNDNTKILFKRTPHNSVQMINKLFLGFFLQPLKYINSYFTVSKENWTHWPLYCFDHVKYFPIWFDTNLRDVCKKCNELCNEWIVWWFNRQHMKPSYSSTLYGPQTNQPYYKNNLRRGQECQWAVILNMKRIKGYRNFNEPNSKAPM